MNARRDRSGNPIAQARTPDQGLAAPSSALVRHGLAQLRRLTDTRVVAASRSSHAARAPSYESPPGIRVSRSAAALIRERPPLWKCLLLLQSLSDEMARCSRPDAVQDRERRMAGEAPDLRGQETVPQVTAWLLRVVAEMKILFAQPEALFTGPVVRTLGQPGVAADARAILAVTRQLGAWYERLLELASLCRLTLREDRYDTALTGLANGLASWPAALEEWTVASLTTIRRVSARAGSDAAPREPEAIHLVLTLDVRWCEPVGEALLQGAAIDLNDTVARLDRLVDEMPVWLDAASETLVPAACP